MIPQFITLLREIVGQPTIYKNTITDIDSNVIEEIVNHYDLEYIVASILLILFFVGLFIIISNFQKSLSRRAK